MFQNINGNGREVIRTRSRAQKDYLKSTDPNTLSLDNPFAMAQSMPIDEDPNWLSYSIAHNKKNSLILPQNNDKTAETHKRDSSLNDKTRDEDKSSIFGDLSQNSYRTTVQNVVQNTVDQALEIKKKKD